MDFKTKVFGFLERYGVDINFLNSLSFHAERSSFSHRTTIRMPELHMAFYECNDPELFVSTSIQQCGADPVGVHLNHTCFSNSLVKNWIAEAFDRM